MSAKDINNFIKALETVKGDYTCKVCAEICKNPVILSKCFHMICAEHFEGLDACPDCKADLKDSTTFSDDSLRGAVESTKVLDKIFAPFKTNVETSKKPGNQPDSLLDYPVKEDKPTRERANSRKVSMRDDSASKENKVGNHSHTHARNLSFVSNSSSKINKLVEKRNTKGETALHVACRVGKVDKVTELLHQGANTNTKDNAGWTPLHEAVQNCRLDLVRLLLQHNALINVPGQSNETPLHEAVRYGHKDIAEELVRYGADVNAKNCKGETPLQLASNEMKEVLENAAANIIQTQSVNITLISDMYSELDSDEIRVYCVSHFRTVVNKLKLLAKNHKNLHIETKFTKKVTHLVVDVDTEEKVCESSLDVLQGIVSSLWIVTTDWVMKSTDEQLEQFEKYEVVGVGTTTNNGPRNSRYNKYKQHPGIFNGCHFYFHNFVNKYEISKSIVLTKAILTKLVTDAGGVVLRRTPNPESIPEAEKLIPYHAQKDGKLVNCSHYIIFKEPYQPLYNMQHLKALPIGWFIECIEKYELCEPW